MQTVEDTGDGQGQKTNAKDVTPYMQMLLAPEGGQLIDAKVTFSKGSATDIAGSASPAFSSKNRGGSQKTHDFQTMAQNEKIKVLCTQGGRMVVLDDENGSVSIICSDGTHIDLEEDGIFITTDQKIIMDAKENLKLKAGESLALFAEEFINICCRGSSIRIDLEKVTVNGTDILINEE